MANEIERNARICTTIAKGMLSALAQVARDEEDVHPIWTHPQEVQALAAFGCRCALGRAARDRSQVPATERRFHRRFISELVEARIYPESEREKALRFLAVRVELYWRVLAQCRSESGGIEAETLFKAIGARFQELCFHVEADDSATTEDAARVLFLRHVGVEVFRISHDAVVDELSKRP
jgi:hypothetical protein